MRVRIRTNEYSLEYDGSAALWDELLRPVLGGPPAVQMQAEPEPAAEPTTRPSRAETSGIPGGVDVDALYTELARTPGRRAERDTVLAAVWVLSGPRGTVSMSEVGSHLARHGKIPGLRPKPQMLKHASRTRMLELVGQQSVRLTPKGRRRVAELLGTN